LSSRNAACILNHLKLSRSGGHLDDEKWPYPAQLG
jgi:hypothetical protein